MDTAIIHQFPKVDLHCHLDGSVSLATLEKFAEKEGQDPSQVIQAVAPEKCEDLAEYLKSFDFILSLLQTKENLTEAAYDVVRQAAEDGVCYIEIRFAPLLHQQKGLTVPEIISSVCEGIEKGMTTYQVESNVLICGMRHHSQKDNQQLFQEVSQLNQARIVGFDFAGDEKQVSNQEIAESIQFANQTGYQLTIHSGECGCYHNVLEGIRLGATRIGHGVAIRQDKAAMAFCRETKTLLEMCPTSNLQTNAISSWEEYPLRLFMEEGILCCINTDNRTVSNTNLTQEYQLLATHCQLTYEEMKQLNINGINGSFAVDSVKEKVLDKINRHI